MNPETLTYWGIFPESTPAPEGRGEGYLGPHHDETLARLLYAIDAGVRCVRLHGLAGVGKTHLLKRVDKNLTAELTQTAYLNTANREPAELLFDLGNQLGLALESESSISTLWRKITDRLSGIQLSRQTTLLMIDQFEGTPAETARVITRLARLEGVRLTLIVSQTDISQTSFSPVASTGFRELVDFHAEVFPLESAEVAPFISACWPREPQMPALATDEACQRIHELTAGIPRRIRRLMSVCLAAGMTLEAQVVDAELAENIATEMFGRPHPSDQPKTPHAKAA